MYHLPDVASQGASTAKASSVEGLGCGVGGPGCCTIAFLIGRVEYTIPELLLQISCRFAWMMNDNVICHYFSCFGCFGKRWFYCRTVISRDVENVGENSELDANSAVNNIHEYPFCKFRRLIILIDSLDWSSVRCPTKPLMIFARIYFPRTSFCKSILCFLQYLVLNCLFSRFLSCKSPDTPEVRGGFASNEDGAATTAFGGAHSSTADELWQELRFIGRRMTYLFFWSVRDIFSW